MGAVGLKMPHPIASVTMKSPKSRPTPCTRAPDRSVAGPAARKRHGAVARCRTAVVAAACRRMDAADGSVALDALAAHAAMSPFHFHRVFRAETGLTPKAYANAARARRLRGGLHGPDSITAAIYGAGFNSNSRFYESAAGLLGMHAKEYQSRGHNTCIRFAVGECSLGAIVVAQSERGICAILLGDDPERLVCELQDQFCKARLIGGDADFESLIARVVGCIEEPAVGLDLPLDIRGTVFQERVWQALREIPVGGTASYAEIAARIGLPKAARAVAGACGANRIAVAIPCHRVVRQDGALSGYRWGVERKRELLRREGAQAFNAADELGRKE